MKELFRRSVVIYGWATFAIWILLMWHNTEKNSPAFNIVGAGFIALWFLLPALFVNVLYELILGRRK